MYRHNRNVHAIYNQLLHVKHTAFTFFRDIRFSTMWYVRPAKAQTRLRICAV